jgi:hypothetical protein
VVAPLDLEVPGRAVGPGGRERAALNGGLQQQFSV